MQDTLSAPTKAKAVNNIGDNAIVKISWFRKLLNTVCRLNPSAKSPIASDITKKGGKELMNIPTCFDHPADDPILLLHKWQVDICSGNRCAATVLAYLVSVYESDLQAKSDLTTEYRHYTHEAIERGVLNQYGKAAIVRALKALEQGKIIIKHPAKANQYALCTETINSWLGRSRPQHEQAEQNNPDLEPDDSEAISNPAGETGEAKWLS